MRGEGWMQGECGGKVQGGNTAARRGEWPVKSINMRGWEGDTKGGQRGGKKMFAYIKLMEGRTGKNMVVILVWKGKKRRLLFPYGGAEKRRSLYTSMGLQKR